jgi:hypothetical protein
MRKGYISCVFFTIYCGSTVTEISNFYETGFTPQLDSRDDQYSIMKGFTHGYENYYKERDRYGSIQVGVPQIWTPFSKNN